MSERISDIMASWGAGRNVLLYGPPATGKTRLISELFDALKNPPEAQKGILLDVSDASHPFSRPQVQVTIPQPTKVVWTTFHQSYSYEDFVLGLRPEITESGTRLSPWAGVFLDAALELASDDSEYESVVIFVDEINRGNAARIFGEFMTFLDFDYRAEGSVPLPLPLRQLAYEDGVSEPVCRPGGKVVHIPEGFEFPRHVYLVATMNSVDRAAVPIDSALARRFDRLDMRPQLSVLADLWELDVADLPVPTQETFETLGPAGTGYLILDRLNVIIATDLGPEFELGHGLLAGVRTSTKVGGKVIPASDDDLWRQLARTWDDVVFPQLEDRYSGRPEQLIQLLKVDTQPPTGITGWNLRTTRGGTVASRTLEPTRLSDVSLDVIKRSLRWLTF